MDTIQEPLRQVSVLTQPAAPVSAGTPKRKTRFKLKSIIRYPIDIISVAVVLATVSAQFIAYYQGWPWYTLFFIMIGVRSLHLIEHNHTHLRIFRPTFLNEMLGYLFFISNGVGVEGYELHHARNHHRFAQQWGEKGQDWSSTFGFEDCQYPDKPVNAVYYCLTYAPIAIMHCLIAFLRMPGTPIFWGFLRSAIVFLTVSALLIARDPWNWFLFFGLPMIIVWGTLGYSNYQHHVGCDMEEPHKAARENLRVPSTSLGFNIGYHVEHHMKPTLHWSLLPRFHQTNRSQIPQKNFTLPRFGKIRD